MIIRLVLGLTCLFVLSQILKSQSAAQDDIKASQGSCRLVQMTLAARERHRANGEVRENDEFTAAAKACKSLEKVLAEGDSAEVQKATQSLRSIFALLGVAPSSPREQFAALEKKAAGLKGRDLFYQLSSLAKRAFNAGETDKAEAYAKQLLSQAPQYRDDWNYGNAIFFGNFVLGRVSLSKGESEPVLQYLELCKNFWESEPQRLDEWRQAIRNGKTPDFGANLNY